MSIYNDPNMIRQIILDYHQNPKNKSLSNQEGYQDIHMHSSSCIDDITIQLKVVDDIVDDLRFDGIGCAISTASTSIMTELLKGKKVADVKKIIQNYLNMLFEKEFDEEMLEHAVVFKNVSRQANRIKCATIGWNGVKQLLDQEE